MSNKKTPKTSVMAEGMKYAKKLKREKYEPMIPNKFAVMFTSSLLKARQAKLLSELVTSVTKNCLDFGEWEIKGISSTIDVDFNLVIINKAVQPLQILEALAEKKPKSKKDLEFTIDVLLKDKDGDIIRGMSYNGCKINSIKGLNTFSVHSMTPESCTVSFSYQKAEKIAGIVLKALRKQKK